MASKKPLVLDASGNIQLVQAGDFIDIAVGGTGANTAAGALTTLGAASSNSLTIEVNRATSAEAVIVATIVTAQTQANLGVTNAATAQTTANAAVPQTTTVNGHPLNANVIVTASDVGLGNVNNTSDINKPVSTLQAAADAAVLVSAKTYADNLVTTLWEDQGTFDASVNTFPTASNDVGGGVPNKGDIWTIGVVATAGPLYGLGIGSTLRATINNPGQIAANWAICSSGLGYVPYNATNPAGYISANQNITVSGDATGTGTTAIALTVTKLNGVSLAALGTGILKNTTGTGVPSIAVAADFPLLNQNSTGYSNNTAVIGGTADAITITPVTTITSYSNGQEFIGAAITANLTGSTTININGLGALTAYMGSVLLPAGGLIAGNLYRFRVEGAGPYAIRITPYDALSSNGDTINGSLVFTAGGVVNGGVMSTLNNAELTTVIPGTPVYNSAANAFSKAIGNTANGSSVIGLASASILAAANGAVVTNGQLTLTTVQWDAVTGQTGGLTSNATYFLNTATVGLLTTVVPTTGYLLSVGQSLSATTMLIRVGTKVQM